MKSRSKNILVLSYIHKGGEWAATVRLIESVKRLSNNYRFFLVGYSEGYLPENDSFIKTIYIKRGNVSPPFRFFKKLFIDLVNTRKAINKITQDAHTIDFVLVSHYLMVYPVLFTKKLPRKKVIFLFHGTKKVTLEKISDVQYRTIIINLLEKLSLILSPIIIVPSLYAETYVRSQIRPFDKKKRIFLVQNSVPQEFTKKISQKSLADFRRKIRIHLKTKVILYSGRVVKSKGLENLVDAFIKFASSEKKVNLIIAFPESTSDQLLLKNLKTSLRKKRLLSKVRFLNDQKTQNLAKIYNLSDISILASELEMAPLSVIESLAQSTPVIGTKTGNIPDILAEINPEFVLKDSSSGEIYDKLVYYFSLSENSIKSMRKKAREVSQKFNGSTSARIFIKLIDSIDNTSQEI